MMMIGGSMFKNYLKIAIRNLVNQKAYSAINIFGLAIGLSACILVGLFIRQEFEYEKHFEGYKNIYRIEAEVTKPSGLSYFAETPGNVKTTLEGKFPEIENISRIFFSDQDLVVYENKRFYEDEIIYADSTFFEIFNHEVVSGNIRDFVSKVNSIVITEKVCEKYFKVRNPIGQIIKLNNKQDFEVVAVVKNPRVESHFTFDFVATYRSLYDTPAGMFIEQWGATFGNYTYLMASDGADIKRMEEKFTNEIIKHLDLSKGIKFGYLLQPIEDIHLRSSKEDEINPNSSITYILILSAIAFFILLLACINFINLTTARAVKRAKEIGIRKVLGAFKHQLIKQFLGESIIVSYLALLVSLVLVELARTAFNNLIGAPVSSDYLSEVSTVLIILTATTLIGLFAGLYPSFILTYFQPVEVLKGGNRSTGGTKSANILRKGLVLFQFTISITLIVMTLMLNRQVDFMRSFDMGFEKEHTIIMETPERMRDQYEAIKQELNSINGVSESSACLGVPVYSSGYRTNLNTKGEALGEDIPISVKMIDDDYQKIFNIKLIAGRMLSELTSADFTTVTVVNEALVKKLGYSDPNDVIGKSYRMGLNGYTVEIVGVVENFHYRSLREEVTPLIFMKWRGLFQELAVKISPNNVSETIDKIGEVWSKFYPEYPFLFTFLDDKINELYKAEERSFNVITTFSLLAIFIACLGLLGLTYFTAEQRRKEIGVRKVMGATVVSLVGTVTSEFMKLILVSNLIAWPLSIYMVNRWLESFAYRTDIEPFVFIKAAVIAVLIAFVTIGYTVLKSAMANPVKSLRYE